VDTRAHGHGHRAGGVGARDGRTEEVVREVSPLTKAQMFRVASLIGGVGAAVAAFAAPWKW
jgi:hypothetical protein